MSKKKTHEEFIAEMKIKHPDIEVLGEYVDCKTKVKCRCKIDDYIFEMRPNNLLQGQGCSLCGRRNKKPTKWNTKTFSLKLKEMNPSIRLNSPYIKSKRTSKLYLLSM